MQIGRVAKQLFQGTNYRAISMIGGANIKHQLEQLRSEEPQIVVATPGRLAEIVFRHEKLSLGHVNTIVLDEVDCMLREPFYSELQTIIENTRYYKVIKKQLVSPATGPVSLPITGVGINHVKSSSHSTVSKKTFEDYFDTQGKNSKGDATIAEVIKEKDIEDKKLSAKEKLFPRIFSLKKMTKDAKGTEQSQQQQQQQEALKKVEEQAQEQTKSKLAEEREKRMQLYRTPVLCVASATAMNNPNVTSFMNHYTTSTPLSPASSGGSLLALKPVIAYETVSVPSAQLPTTITHGVIACPLIKQLEKLSKLLHSSTPELNRAVIFVNDQQRVNDIFHRLTAMGFLVAPLHGETTKDDRKDILKRFIDGRLRLLVTTELSARGLDIPDVTHVINLDLPTNADHYIHRVGRCGRAGKPGLAVSFTTVPNKFIVKKFSKQLRVKIYDFFVLNGQVHLKQY